MKFRCERDPLAEALTTAGRVAVNRGGALPVLAGLKLALSGDQLVVTGTDLDTTIQIELEVGGERDGTVVVPARVIGDIVRVLEPGRVDVELSKDEELQIARGRSNFSVRTIAADEFPRQVTMTGDGVTIPLTVFGDALRQVVRAASTDDARPILTGVLLAPEDDGLRLVATDSYRLAVRDIAVSDVLRAGQRVLVPSKALNELVRLLSGAGDITVSFGERDASFRVDGVRLTTRLIEGEFPNYRQLIPSSYPNRLTVGREAFLDAIRRVKVLAKDSPVRLAMSADGLSLMAIAQDVGQASEQIDAKYEGTELTVAFNADYLSAGVDGVTGDEVRLDALDAMKPAVLRGSDNDFLYLLMPVRVS